MASLQREVHCVSCWQPPQTSPNYFVLKNEGQEKKYPGKRPQTVCVRSVSRKSRDLDALGSREVMVVMN